MQGLLQRPKAIIGLSLKTEVIQDNIPAKVADKVWIGSVHAAFNLDEILKLGITHVLNASGLPSTFPRSFTYFNVEVRDKEEANILSALYAACIFMDAGIEKGGVLVHCAGGRSRSAALVAAYLMTRKNMSFEDAVQRIRAVRPVVSINKGFEKQLRAFEATGYNLTKSHQMMLRARMQYLAECRLKAIDSRRANAHISHALRTFSANSIDYVGESNSESHCKSMQGELSFSLMQAIEPSIVSFLPSLTTQPTLKLCRPHSQSRKVSLVLPPFDDIYACSNCKAHLLTQGNIIDLSASLPDLSVISPKTTSSKKYLDSFHSRNSSQSFSALKISPRLSFSNSDAVLHVRSRSDSSQRLHDSSDCSENDFPPLMSSGSYIPSYFQNCSRTPSKIRGCQSTTNASVQSTGKQFCFDPIESQDDAVVNQLPTAFCSKDSYRSMYSSNQPDSQRNEFADKAYDECHESALASSSSSDFKRPSLEKQLPFFKPFRDSIRIKERKCFRFSRKGKSTIQTSSSYLSPNSATSCSASRVGTETGQTDLTISNPTSSEVKVNVLEDGNVLLNDSVSAISGPWLYAEYISWMGDMVSATSSSGTIYCPNPSCGNELGAWSWEAGAFSCPVTDCLGPTIALNKKRLCLHYPEKSHRSDSYSSSKASTPREGVHTISSENSSTTEYEKKRRGSGILEMKLLNSMHLMPTQL